MNNATSFFGHGDRFGGWDPWNPWLNGRMDDPLGIMQEKVVTAADADGIPEIYSISIHIRYSISIRYCIHIFLLFFVGC